jgi:hypothetical protein
MANNYSYINAALFSIEQTVRRDWKFIWTAAHPFYQIIKYKGNHFNNGFNFAGFKMIMPIGYADQTHAAAGVTVATELSAMTANTYAGAFQLEYLPAHYVSNIAIRESDKKLVESNEHRASFMEFMRKQCLESFKNVLSTDIVSSTSAPAGSTYTAATGGWSADALSAVQSLRWMLSNANVVGGYDQAGDTNWQAVYNTATGAFSLDYVDADMDTIKAKGRSQVDFFLASASTANVYGKFRAAIAPGERWENKDFTHKTGIENYVYRGATVVLDNRNSSGELIGLASDTWYVHLPEEPSVSAPQRIQLTDGWEQVYTLWACVGGDDMGCNIRRTGLT